MLRACFAFLAAQVLVEPMLSAVSKEATEAAEAGWFWRIRPLRCKVRVWQRNFAAPCGHPCLVLWPAASGASVRCAARCTFGSRVLHGVVGMLSWFWRIRLLRRNVRHPSKTNFRPASCCCAWPAVPCRAATCSIRCAAASSTQRLLIPPPPPAPSAQVDTIDASSVSEDGSGHITVLATVSESAALWASNGKQADSYHTTYQVRCCCCCCSVTGL